jgi:hypothetical protein
MAQEGRALQADPRIDAGTLHGMVVTNGRRAETGSSGGTAPRIAAFIWGGKVRPSPTLPYGRWKGAA